MTGEPARRLRLEDMDVMDDTEFPGQGIPMVMMGEEMVLNEL